MLSDSSAHYQQIGRLEIILVIHVFRKESVFILLAMF